MPLVLTRRYSSNGGSGLVSGSVGADKLGLVGNRLNGDGTVNAGATDDTAALNAAIALCQAGTIGGIFLPPFPFCPYIAGQLHLSGTPFGGSQLAVRGHPVIIQGVGGAIAGTDPNSWGSGLSLEYEASVNLTSYQGALEWAIAYGCQVPLASVGTTSITTTAGQAWINGVLTAVNASAATNLATYSSGNPLANGDYWVDVTPGAPSVLTFTASNTWTANSIRVARIRVQSGNGTVAYVWDSRRHPGKFDCRPQAALALRDLMLADFGATPINDASPFLHVTNTEVELTNVTFRGTQAADAAHIPVHDAVRWGGPHSPITGLSSETQTAYSPVGQYKFNMRGCRFDRIRRWAWLGAAASMMKAEDLYGYKTCGGVAPIQITGTPGDRAYNNRIQAFCEATFYQAGALLEYNATQNVLDIMITDQATAGAIPANVKIGPPPASSTATGTVAIVWCQDEPSSVNGNIFICAWDNEALGTITGGTAPIPTPGAFISDASLTGVGSSSSVLAGQALSSLPGLLDWKGHLLGGGGSTPAIVAGAAASAATLVANPAATDSRTLFTWTALGVPNVGVVATITFAKPFRFAPLALILCMSPAGPTAFTVATTTTTAIIRVESTAGQTASTVYQMALLLLG